MEKGQNFFADNSVSYRHCKPQVLKLVQRKKKTTFAFYVSCILIDNGSFFLKHLSFVGFSKRAAEKLKRSPIAQGEKNSQESGSGISF